MISIVPTSPTCLDGQDGTITITADGGNGGFMYYSADTLVPGGVLTGLAAGTYDNLEVRDAAGCAFPAEGAVLPTITPFGLSCSATPVETIGGNEGSISLAFTFGQAPFTIVVDGQIEEASQDTILTGFSAGEYVITVTDAAGCTDTCSTTVIEVDCPPITLTIEPTSPSCAGGSDGFLVATSVGSSQGLLLSNDGQLFQDTLFDVSAGDYQIIATTGAGCSDTFDVTVVDPEIFAISCSTTDVTTAGGSDGTITVDLPTGAGPFTVTFDGGEAMSITEELSIPFLDLAAGTYTTIVASGAGCVDSCTVTINEPGCEPIDFSSTIANPNCAGSDDGSITLTLPEDGGPYTVTVNEELVSQPIIGNLTAGTYIVAGHEQSELFHRGYF